MTREPSRAFDTGDPETWEALARYLSGESPPEEAETLRDWIEAEPSRGELLGALDRLTRAGAHRTPPDLDVEAALLAVRARIDEPDVRPLRSAAERWSAAWRTTPLRVAAGVVLLLGVAAVWRLALPRADAPATVARTFETPVGRTDSLRLDDGSHVLLAPGSRLTVAAGFGAEARTVELEGQALFDVVHDEDRPFTVRAANAAILDLGTTFVVRTVDGEDVQVVVTEGSVLLNAATAAADRGVVLNAGDSGALDRAGHATARRAAATDDDLAWTRGRLVFNDAPLTRVAADLRRWYGIQLVATDPDLAGRHLTATFEGEAADQVLDVIGLALGARIERRADTAFVRPLPGEARR